LAVPLLAGLGVHGDVAAWTDEPAQTACLLIRIPDGRLHVTVTTLWAWDDVALPAVKSALNDEAWRVREMALKVVARHKLDDADSRR
jgi:hypothetical protein